MVDCKFGCIFRINEFYFESIQWNFSFKDIIVRLNRQKKMSFENDKKKLNKLDS